MPRNNRVPRSVLITRFSALGDVAMAIPVVYSVCRGNPDTKFVFVTKKSQESLFINPPANLTVLGIVLDAYADLHGVLRSYALCALATLHGIKCHSIRKGRRNKRALTRSRNKVMLPLLSSRARYREVFFRFGFSMNETFKGLYGDGGRADPAIFASVTAPKKEGDKWVGIAPFAKHPGKIYPTDMMEHVVEEIASKPGVKVFLFGGGEHERKILGEWASKFDNVISLADKRHGFPLELALLSHLDTMVSMDSANMHLASLVGVRVVSVWGATHPYCGFKGFRQKEADIVQLPMTCRPCSVFGNKPCSRGDYHCLAGIPPQMIVNKVKSIIPPSTPDE